MATLRRAALAAALFALAGCGYRFATGASGFPEGTGKVHVPVFENRSAEPEAGAIFARALDASLAAAGLSGSLDAPSRIEGVVLDVGAGPALPGPDPSRASVTLYEVGVRVRVSLYRRNELVCVRELAGSERYLPAVELTGLEANRGEALRRLATRMMQGIEHRLCG